MEWNIYSMQFKYLAKSNLHEKLPYPQMTERQKTVECLTEVSVWTLASYRSTNPSSGETVRLF